jgi:hypothetical protein
MSIIKIKQSDIEKIVSNIVNEQSLGENLNSIAHEGTEISEDEMDNGDEFTQPGEGKIPLKLGLTDDGGYVLYRTNSNGQDEVVQSFKN